MALRFKLGRRERRRDPRVPHYSAITAGLPLPAPPAEVNYASGMPTSLGAMLNDRLGDCTCAGFYHALQVWSFVAQKSMVTEPDADVGLLYQQACGWVPNQPSTDQGGVEQEVLTYLLNTGAPVGIAGTQPQRHKITAFVEVDPAKTDDVKRCVADCGVCYIGFNVPAFMSDSAGATWDVDPGGNQTIVGGHCVILVGYDAAGLIVISWGGFYRMTWAFFAKYVDEAYAIADPWWIEATGKTPAGLTLEQLEAQMAAIRGWTTAFAPHGLAAPVPHHPRLAELITQRDGAQQLATAAQVRADRAESVAKEQSAKAAEAVAERDQALAQTRALSERVTQLGTSLSLAQSERDVARKALEELQEGLKRARPAATPAKEQASAP